VCLCLIKLLLAENITFQNASGLTIHLLLGRTVQVHARVGHRHRHARRWFVQGDHLVALHLVEPFLVHPLHVAADVHLLLGPVHTVRALELRILAALPLLVVAQRRLQLVRPATVGTGEPIASVVVHGRGRFAAVVVDRIDGEVTRKHERRATLTHRRHQRQGETGVPLVPGEAGNFCDA
jgi:hypothetical protein